MQRFASLCTVAYVVASLWLRAAHAAPLFVRRRGVREERWHGVAAGGGRWRALLRGRRQKAV